jgi:hypothetical protein
VAASVRVPKSGEEGDEVAQRGEGLIQLLGAGGVEPARSGRIAPLPHELRHVISVRPRDVEAVQPSAQARFRDLLCGADCICDLLRSVRMRNVLDPTIDDRRVDELASSPLRLCLEAEALGA